MKDNLWRKKTFDGNLRWKATFDGKRPFKEDFSGFRSTMRSFLVCFIRGVMCSWKLYEMRGTNKIWFGGSCLWSAKFLTQNLRFKPKFRDILNCKASNSNFYQYQHIFAVARWNYPYAWNSIWYCNFRNEFTFLTSNLV